MEIEKNDLDRSFFKKSVLWLLVLLMLVVFFVRLGMLLKSDYAPGVDGYSYAVQTFSIKNFGVVKDPDSSPVLYLLGFLARAVGNPVLSNKIGAAFFGAFLLLPAFLLVRRLSASAVRGLFFAGMLSVSPSLTYFSIEFIKNLGALTGLFFLLFFLLKFEKGERGALIYVALILSGLFTFFAHRSSAVLLLVIVGVCTFQLFGRRLRRFLFFAVSAVVLLGIAMLLIRGGFHFFDIARFKGVFSFGPFMPIFSGHFHDVLPFGVILELSFCFLVPYVLLFFTARKIFADRFLLSVYSVLFLLFMPFWNMNVLDMGFRLLIVGVPLASLFFVLFLPQRLFSLMKKRFVSLAVCVVFLFLIFCTISIYDVKKDPDYALYKKVVNAFSLPADSLLISHQGLNFFYTYEKWDGPRWEGSLCYIPEYHVPKKKLWRLAHGVTFYEWKNKFPNAVQKGKIRRCFFPYHLVREDIWQKFLKMIPRVRKHALQNWYNPHTVRPAFLRVHQKNI